MRIRVTVEMDVKSSDHLEFIREGGIDEFWAQLEQRRRDMYAEIVSVETVEERRWAVVQGMDCNMRIVTSYLPNNYSVMGLADQGGVLIAGEDVAGWTLDGYVRPRLSTGLMSCTEISQPEGME